MNIFNYKNIVQIFSILILSFALLVTIGCQENSSDGPSEIQSNNNNNDGNDNPGTLSVSLSWTPPIYRTDGSSLTNLAGYRLYYGTASENYSEVVNIDTAGVTEYVLENLSPNTYFFAITAIDSQGVESTYSLEVRKTLG